MDEIENRTTGSAIASHPAEDETTSSAFTEPAGTAETSLVKPWPAESDSEATSESDPGPAPVESAAALARHPLHPMIVPLPIGAFVGAFVSDVAYARTHDPFWARSARLLTDAGIVTGLVAASLGAVDFTGRERIRRLPASWAHAGGNAAVLGLAVLSRLIRQRDERAGVMSGGLALSATAAALLGVTGWLGGELSYRHRIGVMRREH
jgi:uncharacterized membrane protein